MSDLNSITNRLINQGYNEKSAAMVASEMVMVAPSLYPLVDGWLNGDETDYECQGYSISGLMKARRMTYPAALLTIDWLIKEPVAAKESLKRGVR